MSKVKKIIQLINLLNHRDSVTFDTIKEVCNIPKRTAYRYLNTISEVNVPVYFDSKTRGYRLNAPHYLPIEDLELTEAVLTVVALQRLLPRVNDAYRKDVGDLITKLLVRQSVPIEDALRVSEKDIESELSPQECSRQVTDTMVQAAVMSGRTLRLTLVDGNGQGSTVVVERPSLRFRGQWQLHGIVNQKVTVIPMSDIVKCRIV